MHQRDYILRVIEQLGAALAEIRRRILGGAEPAAVSKALSETADRAGLSVELLRSFTLDTLHMFAAPTGEVEPARCWIMAEILYLDGLHAALDEREEEATDRLIKARALYDLIRPAGGMIVGFPEAAERITEIDRRLGEIHGGEPKDLGGRPSRSRRASARIGRTVGRASASDRVPA